MDANILTFNPGLFPAHMELTGSRKQQHSNSGVTSYISDNFKT